MKKTKRIILILIVIIIMPYLFVEMNTFLFGGKLAKSYKMTNLISDVEYYKVFHYTWNKSKVYYVDGNVRAGHFIWFKKKGDEWEIEKWETVWSEEGSASGFTVPFYR